jgi:hypothetical protein
MRGCGPPVSLSLSPPAAHVLGALFPQIPCRALLLRSLLTSGIPTPRCILTAGHTRPLAHLCLTCYTFYFWHPLTPYRTTLAACPAIVPSVGHCRRGTPPSLLGQPLTDKATTQQIGLQSCPPKLTNRLSPYQACSRTHWLPHRCPQRPWAILPFRSATLHLESRGYIREGLDFLSVSSPPPVIFR